MDFAQLEAEEKRREQRQRRFNDDFPYAMRKAGVEAVRISYDGGNDESFCHPVISAEVLDKLDIEVDEDEVSEELARQLERWEGYCKQYAGNLPSWIGEKPTREKVRRSEILEMATQWSWDVGGSEYAREVEYGPGGSGYVDYDLVHGRFSDHHGERNYSEDF